MFLNFASQYQALACDICYEYSNSITDPDTDAAYKPQDIPDHIPRELLRIVSAAEGCDHKFCLPCLEKAYLSPPFALVALSVTTGYLPCPCPYCEAAAGGAWTLQDLFCVLSRPAHKRLTQLYREFRDQNNRKPVVLPFLQRDELSRRIRAAEFPHLPVYCLDCDVALEKTVACNEIRHCSYCYCWICGLAWRGTGIPGEHWKTCPQFEHLYVKFGVAPSYVCQENHCYSEENSTCLKLSHEAGQKELFNYRKEAQLARLLSR